MSRSIRSIALEIRQEWKGIFFGAVPYLNAMLSLESIDDEYGMDEGRGIVAYFLANASSFRGEKARELKTELKTMLKSKKGVKS